MRYAEITRSLMGVACLIAPLLNVVTTLLYLLDNRPLEAVIGLWTMTLYIAAYLGIAHTIGQSRPVYGAVVASLAILHAVGISAYQTRAVGQMLVIDGTFERQEQVWDLISLMPVGAAYMVLGLLGPILPIVSAVGLMRTGVVPLWSAAALAVAGVVFFLAQVLNLAYSVTYPLYALLFVAGFVPVGLHLMRVGERARQPAST